MLAARPFKKSSQSHLRTAILSRKNWFLKLSLTPSSGVYSPDMADSRLVVFLNYAISVLC
jgi:hypothetical protein